MLPHFYFKPRSIVMSCVALVYYSLILLHASVWYFRKQFSELSIVGLCPKDIVLCRFLAPTAVFIASIEWHALQSTVVVQMYSRFEYGVFYCCTAANAVQCK